MSNPKIGRNDPCPCGSKLKYKKCCLLKEEKQQQLSDSEWQDWFAHDLAQGQKNLEETEKKP